MSTKYIARAFGQVFKRGTENRKYAFAVIGIKSVRELRAQTEADARKSFKEDAAYYADVVSGVDTHQEQNPANQEARKERAIAYLAAGVDGLVAERLKDFDARGRLLNEDGSMEVYVHGWASRYDLAQKVAGTLAKRGWGSAIVPAEVAS